MYRAKVSWMNGEEGERKRRRGGERGRKREKEKGTGTERKSRHRSQWEGVRVE
jgi:hypothetical protein